MCWSGRLAKSRARTRLEESNCVEHVKTVAVDWDDEINDAVVAVAQTPDLIDSIISLQDVSEFACGQYTSVDFL
jgi:hypothetical protein